MDSPVISAPPRSRLSVSGEWIAVAGLLLATIAVGLLVVRELRVAPRAFASAVDEGAATTSAVPADAVSVPALVLGPTVEIKVGDDVAALTARLDPAVMLVSQSFERGPLGRREVRSYSLAATRFIIVAEPFERHGAPRVAAIYLR
jgi:hypothetical protein